MSGSLWASVSTLTFIAACGGSGTADDGAVWTVSPFNATESTYNATKGVCYIAGSSGGSISISTSAIPGEITQVKVEAYGYTPSISYIDYFPRVTVSVGGTAFYSETKDYHLIGETYTDVTFTGSASGTIVVGINQPNKNTALYCKSIEVTYTSDIVAHSGDVVAITTPQTVGNLTVENGGQIVLTDKKLTVTGDLVMQTTMGGGSSAQLVGATSSNFEVTGDTYIDITLGDGANPAKWHAFTVPFPVDATNGIFDTGGNQLTNETHYAIMDYHGDLRADGQYGWKKFKGVMTPGSFYLLTTDGLRTTFRMKKAAGDLLAAAGKEFVYYTGSGDATDFGWNGLGNPTCQYVKVDYPVQVLDPDNYVFVTKLANKCNFVVGTPFFYQASSNGTMNMLAADASAFYAPARTQATEQTHIPVAFGNAGYMDYLYVSSDADASPSYEIGKDLLKMVITDQPSVPQIFGLAYNTRLCMVNAPWTNGQAAYALSLYAPKAGTYTIAAPEANGLYVYLTSNGAMVAEISSNAHALSLQKGDNEGFGLLLSETPLQTPTAVDRVYGADAKAEKILLDNRILIRRGGALYDVTGKTIPNPSAP